MGYRLRLQQPIKEVVRIKIEGGQTLFLNHGTQPFQLLHERSIELLNLVVAPAERDWKPSGCPGNLILLLGDVPMYQAPVEFMMAEWLRYQIGASPFFLPMVLPVRQSVSLRSENTTEAIIVDMHLHYQRDVV